MPDPQRARVQRIFGLKPIPFAQVRLDFDDENAVVETRAQHARFGKIQTHAIAACLAGSIADRDDVSPFDVFLDIPHR